MAGLPEGAESASFAKHDDEEGHKGPIRMRPHAETRPPALNGDEEREPSPDQGRDVQLYLCPGQNEPAQALQDLGYSQPEDDRQEDREIAKGVHGIELN